MKNIFKSAKNRMILWTVLIVGVLLWMKVVVPEPFPQLHSRTLTFLTSEQYDEVIATAEVTQDAYPSRYYDSKMGYYKAYALYSLVEYEKSLDVLEDYIDKTTREKHLGYKRLLADLHLELGNVPLGLELLLELYQEMPLRKLTILKEIEAKDPDFVVAMKLDPKKDALAYDVFTAFRDYRKKAGGFSGKFTLPQTGKAPLKESLFFAAEGMVVQSEEEESIVSGVIYSRVALKTMGFRLTAFGQKDLYLDESECEIIDVKKGEANPFSCVLGDAGPVTTVVMTELKYESN